MTRRNNTAEYPTDSNNVCVGVGCDLRFTRGNHTDVEITLCDKCLESCKTIKKTKRQREEAECNEVVDIVYRRLTR